MLGKRFLREKFNSFYYPGKGNIPLPKVIMIEPTNTCNLRCSMCYVQAHLRDRYFLSPLNFENIINLFPKISELIFCGIGEPFLNKDIFNMINIAKARGIPFINLVTNGKLLDKEISEKIVNSGINRIQISVHSFNPEIFAKIRNEDSINLSRLKENIKQLLSIRKSLNKPLKVCCNSVVTKFNFAGLCGFIKEAKNLGVDRIEFIQLSTYSRLIEDINAPLKYMPEITKEARKFARRLNIEVGFLNGNEYGRCYQLWDFMMIHADGNISPCNGIFPTENIRIGNIFQDSVDKIWNSEKYRKIRKLVAVGKLENCKYCESGYCLEGINLAWIKNYYFRPVKRIIKKLLLAESLDN